MRTENGPHGPNPCFPESRGGGAIATGKLSTVALTAKASLRTPIIANDSFDARAIQTMDWEGGAPIVKFSPEIPSAMDIATATGKKDSVVLASVGSMDWGS